MITYMEKSFNKSFVKTMMPIVFSFLLTSTISIVDNFMVAKIDKTDNPIAAIVIVTEIIWFFISFMIGINVLGQIFLSQFFGSKKRNKFKETLKIIALINFKISIIMFLIIFFLNEKIVRIFNNKDKEIIDLAIKYLNIMCFTIIASSISLSFLDALISIGRTKPFVIVSIISLILNVIFNFIFIYEFNLGIEGAAFSSLLSKIFELIVVCILVYKFKEWVWFGYNIYSIDLKLFKEMIKKFPIAIGALFMTSSNVALTAILTRVYGKYVNQSLGISYSIAGLMFAILPAINQTTKFFIGKSLGASKFIKAKKETKKILLISFWFSIIIALIFMGLAFILPNYFLKNSKSIWYAKYTILIFAFFVPIYSINTTLFAIAEAGGRIKESVLFQNFFQVIIAIPILLIFGLFINLNFEINFLIFQLLQFIPFVFGIIVYKNKKWINNIVLNF